MAHFSFLSSGNTISGRENALVLWRASKMLFWRFQKGAFSKVLRLCARSRWRGRTGWFSSSPPACRKPWWTGAAGWRRRPWRRLGWVFLLPPSFSPHPDLNGQRRASTGARGQRRTATTRKKKKIRQKRMSYRTKLKLLLMQYSWSRWSSVQSGLIKPWMIAPLFNPPQKGTLISRHKRQCFDARFPWIFAINWSTGMPPSPAGNVGVPTSGIAGRGQCQWGLGALRGW